MCCLLLVVQLSVVVLGTLILSLMVLGMCVPHIKVGLVWFDTFSNL